MSNSYNKWILLFALKFTLFLSLGAQERKISFTAEYSPNFSNITDQIVPSEISKLSHNVVLRLGYSINSKVSATIGIAYFNVGNAEREMEAIWPSSFGNPDSIFKIKSKSNFNYLIIPIGVKYKMGQWHIIPELGLGLYLSNNRIQTSTFPSGETEVTKKEIGLNSGEFSNLTVPISFTLLRGFSIGNKSFSTGLKAYYGLNQIVKDVPRKTQYYGLGLVFAINI